MFTECLFFVREHESPNEPRDLTLAVKKYARKPAPPEMNDKLPLLFSILPKSRQDPWSVKFLYEPFLYKKTLATMARPWSLAIPTYLGGTV